MPSGYTADIYDGKDVSLRGYLMQIGRGMGFAILQRDEDMKAPVRKHEAQTDRYDRHIAEGKQQLAKLQGMTTRDLEMAAEADYAKLIADQESYIASKRDLQARYEAMRKEVAEWEPPEELAGVKEMALQQLDQSIEFDCGTGFLSTPVRQTPESWRAGECARIAKDIERDEENRASEIERTNERNRYIDLFYEALPAEEVAA